MIVVGWTEPDIIVPVMSCSASDDGAASYCGANCVHFEVETVTR